MTCGRFVIRPQSQLRTDEQEITIRWAGAPAQRRRAPDPRSPAQPDVEPPRSARGGGHTCWSASLSVGPPAADAALVSQALHPAPPWPRLCPGTAPPGPPTWSSHRLPTCTQAPGGFARGSP